LKRVLMVLDERETTPLEVVTKSAYRTRVYYIHIIMRR